MKKLSVRSIELYQKTLSPDHGWVKVYFPNGYCRHYPSCSEYTRLAFLHNSAIKAGLLSTKRVLLCNPFVKPMIDLSYKGET